MSGWADVVSFVVDLRIVRIPPIERWKTMNITTRIMTAGAIGTLGLTAGMGAAHAAPAEQGQSRGNAVSAAAQAKAAGQSNAAAAHASSPGFQMTLEQRLSAPVEEETPLEEPILAPMPIEETAPVE